MKQKIVIVDYGVGNVYSVYNALLRLGYAVAISSEDVKIKAADFLILPGVGAFKSAINNLRERKLDLVLSEEVLGKHKPILGICVGMQMFATVSEEGGTHKGLDWISGRVTRFNLPKAFAIPHVGWNDILIKRRAPLFERSGLNSNFYFDHAYHFQCDQTNVAATCDYGTEFVAAVQKNNICGVQFHPEKSQTVGLKLFRSFLSQ